jgi:hypothetical protein
MAAGWRMEGTGTWLPFPVHLRSERIASDAQDGPFTTHDQIHTRRLQTPGHPRAEAAGGTCELNDFLKSVPGPVS